MSEGTVPFQGKQQLLERCRELEFVDDVQYLKCTRCNRLTLEHWYTNCCHTLCANCKRLLSGGRCRCPHCGQFILHIKEQSTDFEEKVNNLVAKCPNSKYGCPLVTTVKQLQKHLDGCEWTKEYALPALYRGTNTTQMLLKEMSGLKEQMGEMKGTIGFLLNELHKRQEVEEEIKKSVEMSVEDIKSRLNGLSSDLHFETTTLKVQTEKINFEQLQSHFSSKEEVKQQEQQLTKLDIKTTVLFQMLDEKVEKCSQRLNKEIETINVKIKAGEDKMEVMRIEDKIFMDNFQQKQIAAVENCKQELFTNNKDLQGKVKKSNVALKTQLQKLSSDLNQTLEQKETSFKQKLINDINSIEKKSRIKGEEIDKRIKSGFEKQKVAVENCRKKMETFSEEIKKKMKFGQQEVEKYIKGSLEKLIEIFNNHLQHLSCQVHNEITQKSHYVEKKTEKLKEEIDQSNVKISEIEKNIDGIFNSLLADYKVKLQIIQQLNPQLNLIETFQRGIAIEQLLNRKSSLQQLVDSFLFGSAEEQMVFESLCFKWTITHQDVEIHEHLSDIFHVFGFQLMAQLRLTIKSDDYIDLYLSFKIEEGQGQLVDIKHLPMVTYVIKDLSGHNKNSIRYDYYLFNKSLQYNEFGYKRYFSKSEFEALTSPGDASLEVLVLVEPMTIMNKPLSVDGTITDIVEHYSRKLQMAKEQLLEGHWSPSFLTHAGGYRVAVELWLNGPSGNNGIGLVAWIRFLSSEFDSRLDDKFNHETSITLVNQLDASKNITVKKQAKFIHAYTMQIVSENEISSGGFLMNDSFTYHVTIKPIKK